MNKICTTQGSAAKDARTLRFAKTKRTSRVAVSRAPNRSKLDDIQNAEVESLIARVRAGQMDPEYALTIARMIDARDGRF